MKQRLADQYILTKAGTFTMPTHWSIVGDRFTAVDLEEISTQAPLSAQGPKSEMFYCTDNEDKALR